MSALSLRIRKARRLASITQNELAHRIGVKRSAVTQWENANGTKPNVEHLIRIAIEAGVRFRPSSLTITPWMHWKARRWAICVK